MCHTHRYLVFKRTIIVVIGVLMEYYDNYRLHGYKRLYTDKNGMIT